MVEKMAVVSVILTTLPFVPRVLFATVRSPHLYRGANLEITNTNTAKCGATVATATAVGASSQSSEGGIAQATSFSYCPLMLTC